MRVISILSFLGLAAVVCIGISIASSDELSIKGSGHLITDTRALHDFRSVRVGGAFTVDLNAGTDYRVEVQTDDNLVKYVETEVDGGILTISMKDGYSYSSGKIHIAVTMPAVEGIEVSGATTLNAANVHSSMLKLNISGASHLNISGEAESLECDLSGASTLAAESLKVGNARIECSGASRANVYASTSLKTDVSGASHVRYLGNPASVSNETSGASSVEKQ